MIPERDGIYRSSGQLDGDGDGAADGDIDSDIWKAAIFGAMDGVLTSFAVVAGAAG